MTTHLKTESTSTIIFHVRGIPKPQPRPRARAITTKDGRTIASVYDGGGAKAWRIDVMLAGRDVMPPQPLEGPLRFCVYFYLPRPHRLNRKKDPDGAIWADKAKCDIDNLIKPVLDSMTAGGWWIDDCQIVSCEALKMYHAKDGAPGATIMVRKQDLPTSSYKIKPPAVPA